MAEVPDYYAILEVTPTATEAQIRTAYKKAALKWHPDRVPSDSPERPVRTKKFQAINDAYYTLSNAVRRKEYDEARQFGTSTTPGGWEEDDADEEIPRPNADSKPNGGFWEYFTGRAPKPDTTFDTQWGSAFSEMMNEADFAETGEDGKTEVPTRRFWSILGAVAGGTLGFIVGNLVGATAGGLAGHKLGGIRDQKGKSVYEVFNELDQDSKAKVLSELAAKIFQGAIS